ncbi:MAG: OmpA family protein [Planctomycetaceae bacterium]|jgi:chemotaxis protein MotB|nr:OmpA family protein [Planctomycetaceae bacterium]
MPKQECPEGPADWVLTFGDMMSLLLCFFIMLYAISTLEIVKAQAVSDAIRSSFGGKRMGSNERSRSVTARTLRQSLKSGGPVQSSEGDNPRVMNIRDMGELVRGGVILFDLNSDELSDKAKSDLARIYDLISGSPNKIEIRGHAGPTEKTIYASSWDLSFSRAMVVKEHLQSLGLPERAMRVSQDAQFAPISRGSLPADADPKSVNSVVEILQLLDTIRAYQGDSNEANPQYLNQGPP